MRPSSIAVAALFLTFVSTPSFAEPFLLSEPHVVPGYAFNDTVIGSADHGFLLAGTVSNRPVASVIDANGEARLGAISLAPGSASSIGEPVFAGGRWVVPVTPDFLNPQHFLISEVSAEGVLLREPRAFVLPNRAHVEIAGGADGFLVASTRFEGVFRYALTVRALDSSLAELRDEVRLPGNLISSGGGLRYFRVVRDGDGYAIAYAADDGLYVARLTGDGFLKGDPVVVTRASVFLPDLVALGEDLMVVWAEQEITNRWTIRSARVPANPTVDSTAMIDTVDSMFPPALFLREVGDEAVVVWQGVTTDPRAGMQIFRQALGRDGRPSGARREVTGRKASERVRGAGARGDDLLLAWERHINGVGSTMSATIVRETVEDQSRPATLSYATPKGLALSATVDGTIAAAWIEESSVGDTLWAGRYDRNGRRLALDDLRFVERRIRSLDVSVGGGTTLLVWNEFPAIYGAFLRDDLTFRDEPFVIATDDRLSLWDPRVTWDGSRFVVVWSPNYDLAAAYVSTSGSVQQRGIIASFPPFNTPSYRFQVPSIAANAHGVVVAAFAQESNACSPLLGCPEEKSQLALIRFDDSTTAPVITMRPVETHPMPDIATDGRDFVVVWRTDKDIRATVIAGLGATSTDKVIVDWRSSFFPNITWSGSEYFAGWGYSTGDVNNIAAVMLDRAAATQGPVRMRQGIGGFFDSASFAGDALIGWVGGVNGSRRSEAVFGEFFRELGAVTSRRRSVSAR